MKTKLIISIVAVLILIIFSCKKDPTTPSGNKIEIGQSTTDTVAYFSAKIKTVVESIGGNEITQHGHCWNTETKPTIENNKTSLGKLENATTFTSVLADLEDNTTYFVRPYLTYPNGTLYGDEQSFTTSKTGKPVADTTRVTEVTLTSAHCSSSIMADSGFAVTQRGFCWDTVAEFTLQHCMDTTVDGSGLGAFSRVIEGLHEGYHYRVKSYAINTRGISYGESQSFATISITLPTVSTKVVSAISATWAVSGGNVTGDGHGTVTARGICWGYDADPTLENCLGNTVSGAGLGNFVDTLTGLTENTMYYARAYATNEKGTAYGLSTPLTTSEITSPTVGTSAMTNLTMYSAQGGGNVTSDGGGTVTERGLCWSTSEYPTYDGLHTSDGEGTGVFISTLTGLTPTTNYFSRAYAINEKGISYGNQVAFTTLSDVVVPVVTTQSITNISQTTAMGGGNVTSDGGGSVTARGVCWSTSPNPTLASEHTDDGTGTGSYTSDMTGLVANATYYVRAYATNEIGTGYGQTEVFTTLTDPVLPAVTTREVTDITQTTANSGGNVTSDGGAPVTARGVCWSTQQNPDLGDGHTTDGSGTGEFTSLITGLTPNTFYYVRAYATNSVGTSYGNQQVMMTSDVPTLPTVSTSVAINITETGATTGGTVHADGGSTVTGRGVCYSTTANPSLANSYTTNGSGLGAFVSILTGLDPNTRYYVRAWATNDVGTAYGEEITFITLSQISLPLVTTDEATNITQTTATSGGNVTSDGGGTVSARGVCWSTSANPTTSGNHTTDGSGTGVFSSNLTGLTANTLYHVRAYATNETGTSYGNEVTFTTLSNPVLPTVTTESVTEIATTTATSGGNVTNDGGADVTSRGVCWSTSNNPTLSDSYTSDGSGTGTFTSYLTGLNESTTYFVRAYATNSVGTSYGNEVSFTTLAPPWQCGDQITYEGQVYNTVEIGTQCWFKENLNVGNKIIGTNSQSNNGQIEKYCYDNDEANCTLYGGLYQWDEIMNYTTAEGTQGICPSGWHIPTDNEWKILEGSTDTQYAIGDPEWDLTGLRGYDAGKRLKDSNGWYQWGNGNNSSYFTAKPGGYFNPNAYGFFVDITKRSSFWTSSELEAGSNSAYFRDMHYSWDNIYRQSQGKITGLNVRCIKN